jgi:hypothetical protein
MMGVYANHPCQKRTVARTFRLRAGGLCGPSLARFLRCAYTNRS